MKVDCLYLEMLIRDAFTFTDTTDTSITFSDGNDDVEIAALEPLEAVAGLHHYVPDREWHKKA